MSSTATIKPKLIVFDLDYTLWPFWVDTHVDPPFKLKEDDKTTVVDSLGKVIKHYEDIPLILDDLKNKENIELGVASRTSEIEGANQLIKLFNWEQYFKYKEIYPGSKIKHFKQFQKNSGYDYKDMLFFDDESRNISELSKIGVCAILVRKGVNMNIIKEGLNQFTKMRLEN